MKGRRKELENTVREKLFLLRDADYLQFSSALIPGAQEMIGVRLPALRDLAKEIAKADWQTFLHEYPCDYFEETMLKGMVIGCVRTETPERLQLMASFIPQIANWSVCDSFCASVRVNQKNRNEIWDFMQGYFQSDGEFEVRFAVVMLLMHYINRDYIEQALFLLERADHPGYYAGMATAWALSVCYVKFPAETERFLVNCTLSDFVYNKTLQKIIESRRVDAEVKEKLRARKRRTVK